MFAVASLALLPAPLQEAGFPAEQRRFVERYCFECHDSETAENDVDLQEVRLDWSDSGTAELLGRVARMLEMGDMPPRRSDQPSAEERARMVEWLNLELEAHASIGGTVIRRLNRFEYENTVRDVFGIETRFPIVFPVDGVSHGFDTVGEALDISPPQMRQYFDSAAWVADELIKLKDVEASSQVTHGAEIAGPVPRMDDRMRLVSSIDDLRRAGRVENFDVKYDGSYRLTLRAAAFGRPEFGPRRLEVRARDRDTRIDAPFSSCRLLGAFELQATAPRDYEIEVDLLEGDRLVLQFVNSPLRTMNERRLHPEALDWVRRVDPAFYDALVLHPYDRGRSPEENFLAIEERMRAGVRATEAHRDAYPRRVEGIVQKAHFLWPTAIRLAETGPAVDLFEVSLEGPVGDLRELARWLPERGDRDDRTYAEDVLRPLLPRVFRRPVSDEELERYLTLTLEHAAGAGGVERGLHLALRTMLCSPDFLYRETRPGPLDEFDLASRLSYFLWSSTPDDELRRLAAAGALSDDAQLERTVRRMIADGRAARLAESFTGQWLGTRMLDGIMPDERLFPHWVPYMVEALKGESEAFFLEVLRQNLPTRTFLDSDFTFGNRFTAAIYGLEDVEGTEMRRIDLADVPNRGGILGQASVMMATSNGVDTSPVIRGVWLLENVLGDPLPSPPSGVPALTPDVSGTTTLREAVAAHRADESCARCHDKIDPLGFSLENYDAIGGWRESYPRIASVDDGSTEVLGGKPVDATGELPDGTSLDGVEELKAWLLADPDRFTHCLAEKLLVYGAGRPTNAADRRVLERIVEENRGRGFLDLVVSVVRSESFRTK